MTRVSKGVVSGMTEEQAQQTRTLDRPMLVYVYDAEDEDARYAMEEDDAFADDKVAVGARFFDCVRIDSESANEDGALAGKARRLPAVLFLRPNYEVAKVVQGRISARGLFGGMCATMKKDYDNCVATVVKKQKAIQKDRIRLGKEFTELARLEEKISNEESTVKRGRLVKKRDALEKKLRDAETVIDERESALYEIKSKATS